MKSKKRYDLYMSGNDMRNVELPIILTSLVLDYACGISRTTSMRLQEMEVGCSVDIDTRGFADTCIIKRVV